MLLKLAFRNIKRSVKDYTIYFVTLLIGIAIFYSFNSIGSQQIMFDIETVADKQQFEQTQQLLGTFSVVIAFVLGFLILYANRFLIKRRKKEFGTYLLLGMRPSSVSMIVLLETIFVGLIALAVGLALGLILSQGLSFLTASLFGTIIANYRFVFSEEAFLATLICFVIIFAVVAIFNTTSVNRYKLIDLLNADKKNERQGTRNPWLSLSVFIVSIGVIMYAYLQLDENGLQMLDDPTFYRATIAMLIGTFLFFWSLAGFLIGILTRARSSYYKGLRMFTLRQITSRINTAFVSLWVVCVMLFFSITVFSCGLGLEEVLTGDAEAASPYDATMRADFFTYGTMVDGQTNSEAKIHAMEDSDPDLYAIGMEYDWDMAAYLETNAPELWETTIKDASQIDFYTIPDLKYQYFIDEVMERDPDYEIPSTLTGSTSYVLVASISDLNGLRLMQGKDAIDLPVNEYLISNNFEATASLAKKIIDIDVPLDIAGTSLNANPTIDDTQYMDSGMLMSAMIMIVPDEVMDTFKKGKLPDNAYLNVDYYSPGESADQDLVRIIAATQPPSMESANAFYGSDDTYMETFWPVTRMYTKTEMYSQANGLRMMITYLALYIGFVFLIATATILAIQQLSDVSDSASRYRLLGKLGCDRRMIDSSMFAQICIYFLAPLGLALCHSACAIGVLSKSLLMVAGNSVVLPVVLAIVSLLAIYAIYMFITYFIGKSIVAETARA